jgi:hypothetical protein
VIPEPSRSWQVTWKSVIVPLLAPRCVSQKAIMSKGVNNLRPQNRTVFPLLASEGGAK